MKRKKNKLGRDVAVIGGAMSHFGVFPGMGSRDLLAEAFTDALATVEKGLDPKDIDALYIGNFCSELFEGQSHLGHLVADWLGLAPRPATRIEGACASSGLAFREGVLAIASGIYDIVLVGGVEKMTDASTEDVQEFLSEASDVSMEAAQAAFTFPGIFGAMASAYMARYHATRKHLMHVSVKNHNNGALNSKAQFGVTLQDVMEKRKKKAVERGKPIPTWANEFDFLGDETVNPQVASPLHLFDCSPISDGAACMILAAEEIARDFGDNIVRVAATAQVSAGPAGTWKSDLTSLPGVRQAASEAYEMAGVEPGDIDLAEVHDCFTIAEIIAIEDLGFFEPGKGAQAIADCETSRDGKRPINISGGLKSKGHPVGATGVAQLQEIWHQLKGSAEGRQVTHKDLRLGMTHNVGGTGGTCAIHILERI